MKAITHHRYGNADQLRLAEVPLPHVGSNDLLVRVRHAAVNPADWHMLTGTPYIVRPTAGLRGPKQIIRGTDMVGIVESVGGTVTGFTPGDRVVAAARGAFAEYVSVPTSDAPLVPADIDLADAAALPIAAITALQGLRDNGETHRRDTVLINGASGGVGTFAIQIAKARGAEVTAVCSTTNVELVRSLGADHVIDYTLSDFTTSDTRFDVILDNVGNRPLAACRSVLADTGVYVLVSGPKTSKLLGPAKRMVAAKVSFAFSSQRAVSFVANETADELATLMGMMQRGELRAAIDRRYPLSETAEAIRHLETGRARGKIIIDITENTK